MTPEGTLKSEIYRPFVSVVIPGVFASAPYVLASVVSYSAIYEIAVDAPLLAWFAYSVIVVFAGMIMEDIGGRIEQIIDWWLDKKDPERKVQWRTYLKLRMEAEYVGQRYLRGLVTRLYFELAMLPSLVVFVLGVALMTSVRPDFETGATKAMFVLVPILMLFLFFEAVRSIKVIGSIRCAMIEASADWKKN